jgi:hypothetical protein
MYLVIQKTINFYNGFYVQVLCDFFVVLYYDEINCIIIFGNFF